MTQSITFTSEETGSTPPEGQPQVDPNRPAWLDPKFQKPEDLANSYREQQAALTRAQQELARLKGQVAPPDETPPVAGVRETDKPADPSPVGSEKPPSLKIEGEKPEGKPDEKPEGADDAAKKVVEASGVDITPFQAEYDSTGDVSLENREKLAEGLKGILGEKARQIVDEFIEARKVVHENDTKLFMEAAGGQERMTEMVQWAAKNWTQGQIDAYNAQVGTGDRHAVLFAVEGLRAQYEAKNGRTPGRVTGSGLPPSNSGAFRSAAEMTAAMRDPRYKTDQAYRDEVQVRLAQSQF